MEEIKQFLEPKIVITYHNGNKYYVVYNNAQPVEQFIDEVEAINFKLELIRSKVISENQISEIEVDILKFVNSTWLLAIEEKYPDIHELTQNVYYEESK